MSPITTGTNTSYQWEWTACDCSGKPKEQMQTQFKAGDRAWFTGKVTGGLQGDKTMAEFDLAEVVINHIDDDKSKPNGRFLVTFQNPNKSHWWVRESCLQPFGTDQPHDFKVGDRVAGLHEWQDFKSGTIKKLGDRRHNVRWDKFQGYCSETDSHAVFIEDLVLLSPHSPQPQQNQQPKEETMKPYAVIVHDLNVHSQASIHGYYTTEAEAKEAAELQVNSRRSNLNIKNYFTITILNTKTGELVGSVTDAPPAVDWAKK